MSGGDQRPRLRVHIVDGRGRALAAPGLAHWLARVAPARARGEVTIALVSDQRVRRLNHRYRRLDEPTDVLSFPAARDAPAGPHPASHATVDSSLGDIVIARGVARRQARQAGHAESTEWRVLALHGLLHLLGYDHESDDGRMARLERRLRRRGGLDGGLIEREAWA